MEAIIRKIELKKDWNKYYFQIELIDRKGKIHVINDSSYSNPIEFRKMVFGLMSAIGNYDLMTLATNNPIEKKVKGYYIGGLKIIENENNEWFSFNQEKNTYTCEKANEDKKEILKLLMDTKKYDMSIEDGTIEKISSESGVFSLRFRGKVWVTHFLCNQIYYGFGYPLGISNNYNEEDKIKASKNFVQFIVSLMRFYKINDLLDFGVNKEKDLIVEITLDNNKIKTITNTETGLGLKIDDNIEIINMHELDKERKLIKENN